eukprot:5011399-Prymnesium_polylepis.2
MRLKERVRRLAPGKSLRPEFNRRAQCELRDVCSVSVPSHDSVGDGAAVAKRTHTRGISLPVHSEHLHWQ